MNDPGELTREELLRYSRHLILPEVGPEGQRQLKGSRVAIVGTGGLGSPAAMYLAAAGVGTLGLIDFDTVETTNLQRQIIHGMSGVDRLKIDSAAERIADINPNTRVEKFETKLSADNALEILDGFDVVLDGSDNFPTRYLVSDACVILGLPNVYGSILRFEGQASVFDGRTGPCYRCLFSEPPPPELVPSCAEAGVLGVLPGIIGTIQASEAIKLILGIGESLIGRLVLFDALAMSFREIKLRKDPACPVCGDEPTQKELIDYEQFCGEKNDHPDLEREISVSSFAAELRKEDGNAPLILDVREPAEWKICKIPGATLVPISTLPAWMSSADRERSVVTYCHTGVRSLHAAALLVGSGFKAKSLRGGIEAWSLEIDPSVARY